MKPCLLLLAVSLPFNAAANPYLSAAARQSTQFIDNAKALVAPGEWNGRLDFPAVYCVTFAEPDQASSVTTMLLGGGTAALARVEYPPQLTAYVVSSTMPAGLDAQQEHQRQLARTQQVAVDARHYQASVSSSTMGPVVVEQFTNAALRGPGNALFPLERHFYDSDKVLTVARSHHFSRPPQRYEVAVLAVLEPDAGPQRIEQVREQVEHATNQLQHSLQQCTAALPPGGAAGLLERTDRVVGQVVKAGVFAEEFQLA